MDLEEHRKIYGSISDAAPGWDAIDARLRDVYGAQEPKHWGTVIKAMLGGPEPIDGISAYESRAGGIDHLHFCTYGYTDLYYNEEAIGKDFSKFGFEMTFRLASVLPEFVQAFGITELELGDLKSRSPSCREIIDEHRRSNPMLITDLARRDG